MMHNQKVLPLFLAVSTITLVCANTMRAMDSQIIARPFSTHENILDFLFFEPLGYTRASEENEQFIRNIQHEMGMDSWNIATRRLSNYAMRLVGRENTFVISTPGLHYLFISQDWFDSLSQQERRFLIGHELSHLQKYHTLKRIGAGIVLSYTTGLLSDLLTSDSSPETKTMINRLTTVGTLIATAYLSRCQEKEADLNAARSLHAAAGGISLFDRFQRECVDPESRFALRRIITTINKIPGTLFYATHPSLETRKNYLEKEVNREDELTSPSLLAHGTV